jgi:hypothetical protein
MTKRAIRLYAIGAAVLWQMLMPSPARAQFQPRMANQGAIGDNYHLEFDAVIWDTSANMSLSNTALGVPGTTIDLKNDLGIQDQKFGGFELILRPAVKHKFRVQLVPVHYSQVATPKTSLIFGGQTYAAGVPVTSTIHWRAWRFGYEYDFAVAPRGFMGVILDVKYTDTDASLTSAVAPTRTASARAPVPALGGILRVNPASHLALTAEISGFKWPGGWIWSGSGDYLDFDTYATLNFVNAFGVELGYRSFDVDYSLTNDSGSFKLSGPYLGAVLRF